MTVEELMEQLEKMPHCDYVQYRTPDGQLLPINKAKWIEIPCTRCDDSRCSGSTVELCFEGEVIVSGSGKNKITTYRPHESL